MTKGSERSGGGGGGMSSRRLNTNISFEKENLLSAGDRDYMLSKYIPADDDEVNVR
jgi:hypothetical protein